VNIELRNVRLVAFNEDESEQRTTRPLTMEETKRVYGIISDEEPYYNDSGETGVDALTHYATSLMGDEEYALMVAACEFVNIEWDTVFTDDDAYERAWETYRKAQENAWREVEHGSVEDAETAQQEADEAHERAHRHSTWSIGDDDDAIDDATEREMREWNESSNAYADREGWPRWCEQCQKVKPFKTPEGKSAPFERADWTDDGGHTTPTGWLAK
jgi:hypothetical protein